jgi:hypothetical protein
VTTIRWRHDGDGWRFCSGPLDDDRRATLSDDDIANDREELNVFVKIR